MSSIYSCILAFSRHNFRTEGFSENPRVKIAYEKPVSIVGSTCKRTLKQLEREQTNKQTDRHTHTHTHSHKTITVTLAHTRRWLITGLVLIFAVERLTISDLLVPSKHTQPPTCTPTQLLQHDKFFQLCLETHVHSQSSYPEHFAMSCNTSRISKCHQTKLEASDVHCGKPVSVCDGSDSD